MNLDDILREYGLPRLMSIRVDDQSGWIFPFEKEARDICSAHGAQFAFVEGQNMQAAAIQDDVEIVVMYAGMFWMLCRLAAEITRSGAFINMTGEAEPIWTPDTKKSFKIPRTILEEGKPFDWKFESIGWKDLPERQMLFYTILSILFRFVIYHEVGHLENDHMRRRQIAVSPILMDAPQPTLLNPVDAIPSQAREIIADNFAIFRVIELLSRELNLKDELAMTKVLRSKLMPNQEELVGFVLTIVFLYFRLADRNDWTSSSIKRLSHPPAPFRLKAILGAILENHKKLAISDMAAQRLIKGIPMTGHAVMSVTLNVYPEMNWLRSISSSEHDEHYKCIFTEIPNWRGRLELNP